MERAGIPVEFVGGRRVTTPEGMEVVRASFARSTRAVLGDRRLAPCRSSATRSACARQVPELGLVGDRSPRTRRRRGILDAGRIPVVAPLAVGPLNVNADEAAAAIALGVRADGCSS